MDYVSHFKVRIIKEYGKEEIIRVASKQKLIKWGTNVQ